MEEIELDSRSLEENLNLLKRRHSQQPQKRKYRISTRRGRRKTCPDIFSPNHDEDEHEENEKKALHYQQLADEHFMLGNHDTASSYYSALLDREFRKSFHKKPSEMDLNNNDVFDEEKDQSWALEYLDLKIVEANEKISVSPNDPEGYLEKAAVLFFNDRWLEAREVLDAGLVKCARKALLKTTLNNLNKLEKAFDKYCQ